MARLNGLMVEYSTVIFIMIRNQAKGLLHGLMDALIEEDGKTENNMEMGRIQTDKAKLRKVSGIKANELSGWMSKKKKIL